MLLQRIAYSPAVGKNAEVLELLRERVTATKAQKRASSLIAAHLTGDKGPTYFIDTELQDLAAYQAFHEACEADATVRTLEASVAPMLASPTDSRLFRVAIPLPATPVLHKPYYTHTAWFYPQPGMDFVVQQLVDERVSFFIDEGESAAMWSGSYGNEGGVFILVHHYQRLADFDAFRAKGGADPVGTLFSSRMARVVRFPQETRLSETLL